MESFRFEPHIYNIILPLQNSLSSLPDRIFSNISLSTGYDDTLWNYYTLCNIIAVDNTDLAKCESCLVQVRSLNENTLTTIGIPFAICTTSSTFTRCIQEFCSPSYTPTTKKRKLHLPSSPLVNNPSSPDISSTPPPLTPPTPDKPTGINLLASDFTSDMAPQIIIRGLPKNISSPEAVSDLLPVAPIKISMIIDKSGKTLDYCFASFTTEEEAVYSINSIILDPLLEAEFRFSIFSDQDDARICFIGHLPSVTGDTRDDLLDTLRDQLEPKGVTDIFLGSKGLATLKFRDSKSAATMDMKQVEYHGKRYTIKRKSYVKPLS